ncbi:ArsC family transcriptional regulator [Thermoplasmatales archaeon SG8-52-4]|nr:MAG: ArsC family transcriptional regulator [Thermoplasmatales archaeon SG8-52-4]
MDKKKVLFLCTNNSCRSQIAEGLLNSIYRDRFKAYSAGINPTKVNPYAVEVMKEIGIDLSKQYSKNIEEFKGKNFDFVVTVCDNAKEACPFFPGEKIIHKSFEDPASFYGNIEDILDIFRKTRDNIKTWIIDIFD